MKAISTTFANVPDRRGQEENVAIGKLGEQVISGILEFMDIPHEMTSHKHPIDIVIPALGIAGVGIDVKVLIKAPQVHISQEQRRIKRKFCDAHQLDGHTVVINVGTAYNTAKLGDYNIVDILYKPGFKSFRPPHMYCFRSLMNDIKRKI